MAETTAAARRAEIVARLDSLTERDREIAREIGAKLAEGKAVPAKLRTERASVREEIEDLAAAMPHVERAAAAEKAAAEAAQKRAAAARLASVETEVDEWRATLLELLAPVADHLGTEAALDSRYKAAQRPVHGGRADGHLADAAGFGIQRLQKLRAAIAEALR